MKCGKCLAALVLLLSAQTHAADNEWEYRLTPYIWLPSLNTDLAFGPNQPVESETDILDVLDFAFLITGEAWKDNWGIVGEFNYLKLSDDVSFAGDVFGAEATIEGVMGSVAYARRLSESNRSTVDALLGLRLWALDTEIDFKRINKVTSSKDWVDPFVGVRGSYKFDDQYSIGGLANVGGFGVGSDYQWEVSAHAAYQFKDSMFAKIGYRHLDIDFDDGNFVMDAAMSGPYIAFDFNW